MNMNIDRYDQQILEILQADGRINNQDLADRIGLSPSPCLRRVRALEDSGLITGYHARVDPVQLGKPLLVFIEITLSQKSPQVFETVRREVGLMPDVLECHLVSGSFDYLVKARLRAMSDYRELLGSILNKIPVPAQSNSYVVMEEVKETTQIPLRP